MLRLIVVFSFLFNMMIFGFSIDKSYANILEFTTTGGKKVLIELDYVVGVREMHCTVGRDYLAIYMIGEHIFSIVNVSIDDFRLMLENNNIRKISKNPF
jgi:hypothetical protein